MEIAQATRVADRDRAIRELKKGQEVLGHLHDRQMLIDQLGRDMLGDQPGADRDVQVMKQALEAACHQLHSQCSINGIVETTEESALPG
jgi:CHAD domain-containing protein